MSIGSNERPNNPRVLLGFLQLDPIVSAFQMLVAKKIPRQQLCDCIFRLCTFSCQCA